MKILCIIPARSGSKGIKNKNLKKIIGNKSLIELAYNLAKKSKVFAEIIISTDSAKYKQYLKSKNIFLPFLRPKKLALDYVNDLEVLKYELKKYENFYKHKFDVICMLQPTSPLRKIIHLKKCLEILKKNKLDAVWTISKISDKYHPIKILNTKSKKLDYFSKKGSEFKSRQLLESMYIRNGIAYLFSRNAILKENKILPKKTGYLIINEPVVNVDNMSDLKKARKLIKLK